VRRFIAVNDCGVRINPMVVDGQIHGGITEGIGQALSQIISFDEDGRCLNASFSEYLLPSALECPEHGFELGETVTPCPHHPIGAKGVGECPGAGSVPCIANAVIDALYHAKGIRHMDIPCSPDRVWAAMQSAPAALTHRAP
jgi:carbon-monoxide dehydrogenase large subunit